jgi:hypothetical protein
MIITIESEFSLSSSSKFYKSGRNFEIETLAMIHAKGGLLCILVQEIGRSIENMVCGSQRSSTVRWLQ